MRGLSGSEIHPSEKLDYSLEEILTSRKCTAFFPVRQLRVTFVLCYHNGLKDLVSVQLFAPYDKVRIAVSYGELSIIASFKTHLSEESRTSLYFTYVKI